MCRHLSMVDLNYIREKKVKVNISLFLIYLFLSINASYADHIEWVKTFGGIKNESIDHVLVCPNNDIIVIGTFSDTLYFKSGSKNVDTLICENDFEDVFIVKFSSHGAFVWATSLAHGPDNYDWWLHPSVDAQGNLFLGGTFIGGITIGKNDANETSFNEPLENSLEIFLTRILEDGHIDWALKLGDEHQEQLWDITSGADGSVYLTGRFWGIQTFFPGGINNDIILTGQETGYTLFTLAYDKDANILWANRILSNYDILSYTVAVSRTGRVAVGGDFLESIFFDTPSGTDVLTSKGQGDLYIVTYDSSGEYLWSLSEGGAYSDQAQDLAFDSQGNLIVTGSIQDVVIMGSKDTLYTDDGLDLYFNDILLAKYDPQGNYLWSINEGGKWLDGGERLQVYKNDKILLSGYYWREATFTRGDQDVTMISNIADTCSHFAAKYTPSGELFWVADVDSSSSTFNTNLAIDSSENVIRAGQYIGTVDLKSEDNSVALKSVGGMDVYLAKFSSSVTSIERKNFTKTGFQLDQNYPNPFNPVTNITYSIKNPAKTSLTVYNILGEEVKSLVNEYKNPGKYIVSFDASDLASGIYFYKLQSGSLVQSRKMIVIK